MPYQPIEDYGVIGDLNTVALVGMNGSIDFMCFPNFDSPSMFARILDDDRGGYFQIAPVLDMVNHKQMYLPDTCILLTRFLAPEGVAEVSDFMPVAEIGPSHTLVRRVKVVRGSLELRMVCAPRFDYAAMAHQIVQEDDGSILFISNQAGGLTMRLRSDAELRIEGSDAVAEFHLEAGGTCFFTLEEVRADQDSHTADPHYVSESFKSTSNYWRRWVSQSNYTGRWKEILNRSAMTLKLLTSFEHGSLVAAPTFSLPEALGGERNWDYRYTWIRDASFTVYGLMRLGFVSEAGAFMSWIEDRAKNYHYEVHDGTHPLQIMYTLDGSTELTEITLPHLEGYKKSEPVRIGNGAADQLQLDIYGELMDSIYLYDKYGSPIHYDLWQSMIEIINWVCDNWNQPDDGIWEVRGGAQHFLYSRLMSWVAVDRAVRLANKRSLPAPFEHWTNTRTELYNSIWRDFWDDDLQAFVQHTGSKSMDASMLLMPLVKFISPDDPRWLSTLRQIENQLVEDSLVFRYRAEEAAPDGLSGIEGAFSMCSFWYAECLSRSGDVEQARLVFEKMLGYANHLGLYAEEVGPSGEHLGNFPQAFTHLALISTAFELDRRLPSQSRRG